MSYISLTTGKLHKKPEKIKFKIFLVGYVGRFYRNLADNADNFLGSDFYGENCKRCKYPIQRCPKIYTRDK